MVSVLAPDADVAIHGPWIDRIDGPARLQQERYEQARLVSTIHATAPCLAL